MAEQPPTPTLDKLRAIRNQSQAIGEFLEWLSSERRIVLAEDHKASWTCAECGSIPKEEVVFVDWLSTDDARWRHKASCCKRVKKILGKRRSIPLEEYEGAEVEHVPEGLYLAHNASIHALLYAYFEIDPVKEEEEKRALLDHVRAAAKAR